MVLVGRWNSSYILPKRIVLVSLLAVIKDLGHVVGHVSEIKNAPGQALRVNSATNGCSRGGAADAGDEGQRSNELGEETHIAYQ